MEAVSRRRVVGALILQGLLAAAFLAAGGAKLAGVPTLVQLFEQIGAGQWFRIVTGLVEVAGAVALLVPGFAALGAALARCDDVLRGADALLHPAHERAAGARPARAQCSRRLAAARPADATSFKPAAKQGITLMTKNPNELTIENSVRERA